MKKVLLSILFLFCLFVVSVSSVNALTIVETTANDEYDTIKNNSIVLGVTKFEPNETLTAGKVSLATYNDAMFNQENPDYEAPKIYYYLSGSWYLIDNDNNASLVTDANVLATLNQRDVFYVNNIEKTIEFEYKKELQDNYELVLENSINDLEIKYNNDILYIPATVTEIKSYMKEKTTGESILFERIIKEAINSVDYIVRKEEYLGTDGLFKYARLTSGNIQITRYLGSDTVVTIPATYEGFKVYSVGNDQAGTTSAQRFNIFGPTNTTSNTTVTNVVISEGIEVIECAAFSGSTALVGPVTLPSTITKIERYAFNGCKKLKGPLVFPEGLTYIGQSAFQKCSAVTGQLEFPSTLTYIGPYAFNENKGYTGDLVIPDSVTFIGKYAFQNCTSLNGKLTLGKNLEVIEDGAFNHCSKLTNESLVIPKSVSRIGANDTDGTHVFYDFANNTFKEFIVEEGSQYFKAIDRVLYNKAGNRMIAFPSSRDGEIYEIPEGVTILDELSFSRAGSPWHLRDTENTLKKIILPNSYILHTDIPSNYLNVGSNLALGLYKYTGITHVDVKADNPRYKSLDGIVYSKDGKVLWYIPVVRSGDIVIADGVTTIKSGAIYTAWDRSQTSITFPASVVEIDDTEIEELNILLQRNIPITFGEGSIFEIVDKKVVKKN